MKKLISFAMVLSVFLTPLSGWASELFGKISYKGAPLKGAEVSVQDKKTKTNDIGFYSVELEPGSYSLGIKLPDGTTKQEKVTVFPQDTEKNLKLE